MNSPPLPLPPPISVLSSTWCFNIIIRVQCHYMLCTSALAQLQLLEVKQFKQSKLQHFIITDTTFYQHHKVHYRECFSKAETVFIKVNTSISQTGWTCRRIEAMKRETCIFRDEVWSRMFPFHATDIKTPHSSVCLNLQFTSVSKC